ncbi:hypothetical protein F4802DRAFT_592399 [Xylaria palmicola]|nr:hypothetical protein F4802DRAFT_592399 [Xylaria palmicola]
MGQLNLALLYWATTSGSEIVCFFSSPPTARDFKSKVTSLNYFRRVHLLHLAVYEPLGYKAVTNDHRKIPSSTANRFTDEPGGRKWIPDLGDNWCSLCASDNPILRWLYRGAREL